MKKSKTKTSSFFSELFKPSSRSVIAKCIFITIIFLFSSMILKYFISQKNLTKENQLGIDLFSTLIGIVIGFIVLGFVVLIFRKDRIAHFSEPFSWKEYWHYYVYATIASILVALVTALFLQSPQNIIEAMNNPGGLFTIIFAVITVVGLWFTVDSALSFRKIITSFSQLHERLIHIIDETLKSDNKDERLRILAYTPAIGFLALPSTQWDKLEIGLVSLAKNKKLEIITLDDEDLAYWHRLFIGRNTLRVSRSINSDFLQYTDAVSAIDAAEAIFDSILGKLQDQENEKQQYNKHHKDFLVRKKFEMMPGFYLIFNDEKAIIVNPFFTPFAFGTPIEIQTRVSRVQMFGVETSDWRVVEDVKELYDTYKYGVPESPDFFRSNTTSLISLKKDLITCINELDKSVNDKASQLNKDELDHMIENFLDGISKGELLNLCTNLNLAISYNTDYGNLKRSLKEALQGMQRQELKVFFDENFRLKYRFSLFWF